MTARHSAPVLTFTHGGLLGRPSRVHSPVHRDPWQGVLYPTCATRKVSGTSSFLRLSYLAHATVTTGPQRICVYLALEDWAALAFAER